ncbi:hypothetical protein ACWDUN_10240 [Mycobacterium sp. NPDC003323]
MSSSVGAVALFGPECVLVAKVAERVTAAGRTVVTGPSPCVGHSAHDGRSDPPALSEGSVHTVVVVIDPGCATKSLVDGNGCIAWRRRGRCARDTSDAAVDAVLGGGARRLVVACRLRGLAPNRRSAAQAWLRGVVRRVHYECAINGMTELSSHYAWVDTDSDVDRVAGAVATWGVRTERPRLTSSGSSVPASP